MTKRDLQLRDSNFLRNEITSRIGVMLSSFEKIVAGANTHQEAYQGRSDLTATMDRGFHIDLSTNDLIQASEDLLRLIRQMQELWLFGTLDPVSEEQEKGEQRDLEALAHQLIAVAAQNYFKIEPTSS